MEHETEHIIDEKENTMEGIDPGLVALLKENGVDSSQAQWNNPLFWIIILGFLRGKGGIFGGDDHNGVGAIDLATASSLAKQDAKLDCLQQGQQEALAAAHNMNMTNLFHSSEIAANANVQRLAAQLAECCCNLKAGQERVINEIIKCCCDLKSGQKDIVNAMCLQFGALTSTNTANTQRILDSIERHADEETQSKLTDCKQRLSNEMQTKEILQALSCSNDNNHSHGGRGKSAA